ncbi:MAG TPA: class I SAM-dependent methyltransferase [Candidatus Sulfotelmatobacter sp.]|nr:class I SAM-dependent methyltransferase [Candidatus Sulfotelmatobacter sp.]
MSASSASRLAELENAPASVRSLYARFYSDYQPDYFFQVLLRHLSSSLRVLEIGAGSGQGHQNRFAIRDRVKDYVGIDPDPAVLFNPYLGEGFQGSADSLPFADQSFDLVFHNYVAEHFPDPLACNREIARVLKTGGVLLFQTPSRFYYSSLAAQITPHWFHAFYTAFRLGTPQHRSLSNFLSAE